MQHDQTSQGKREGSRRRGRLRLVGRGLALAVAAVVMLDLFPWDQGPRIVPAISPFVAIASAIALRAVSWVALLGVPVLVLAVFRRRWFCRYACPVGLLTEQAGRLLPWTRGWAGRRPQIGRWIVLVTLAGACLGYPLLLWLDPLAIFSGFFSAWQKPAGAAALLPAVGLPIVLGLSLLLPGAWCLRICPLGAMQEMVTCDRRKGVVFLPAFDDGADRPSQGSRSLFPADDVPADERVARPLLARRSVFALALGGAWAAFTQRRLAERRTKPIRPPGAVEERQFVGLCIRCGSCVRACPAGIVHPDLGDFGAASLLTPVVRFAEDYCRESCNRCTQVCPSGAIRPLSLAEKQQTQMGVAKVDMALCVLGDDRECQVCRNHCPYEAIAIVWSDATYTCVPVIVPEKCTGCGACEIVCITTPEKAIRVVPRRGAVADA